MDFQGQEKIERSFQIIPIVVERQPQVPIHYQVIRQQVQNRTHFRSPELFRKTQKE